MLANGPVDVTAINSTDEVSMLTPKLVVNELLCFIDNNYDNDSSLVLKAVITDFHRENEILTAKQCLTQTLGTTHQQAVQAYSKKRISDNKVDKSVDDIWVLLSPWDWSALASAAVLRSNAFQSPFDTWWRIWTNVS